MPQCMLGWRAKYSAKKLLCFIAPQIQPDVRDFSPSVGRFVHQPSRGIPWVPSTGSSVRRYCVEGQGQSGRDHDRVTAHVRVYDLGLRAASKERVSTESAPSDRGPGTVKLGRMTDRNVCWSDPGANTINVYLGLLVGLII